MAKPNDVDFSIYESCAALLQLLSTIVTALAAMNATIPTNFTLSVGILSNELPVLYFLVNKPNRRISRGQFLALKMRVFAYYRLIS